MKLSCRILSGLSFLLISSLLLGGCQEPPPSADAPELGHLATIPRATLERPIPLVEGIGELHREVPTADTEAQRYYDQGLAFMASFDWVRAARSFNESLRRDPALAAARLGLARAFLGLESPQEAHEHALEAALLAQDTGLDEREHAWIDLGPLQTAASRARGESRARLLGEYQAALEDYLERWPNDLFALLERGHAADGRPDGWGQSGLAGSLPWYEQALALEPGLFATHHFLAHSYENLGRHEEAQAHAERYAIHAPAVPHAHHMRAHTAPRLGNWDVALDELGVADRLHREAFEAGEILPREDWHFGHNLRLLAAVELHLGELDAAEAHYRETFELDYEGRRAGFYCLPWLEFLLLTERFDEALAAADECAVRDTVLARLFSQASRGEALLGKGRVEEARQALERAREARMELMAATRTTSTETTFLFASMVAIETLTGKLALAEGDVGKGTLRLVGVGKIFSSSASFDAWALGGVRLREIVQAVERAGHSAVARRVEDHARVLLGEPPG